jgi:hypothetical protein
VPPPTAVPGTPFTGPVDADAAEVRWCAYAWPVAAGNSGTRVFFVDQDGEVWQAPNAALTYSGTAGAPPWNAALPAGTGWTSLPQGSEHAGRDGGTWRRTN